MKSIAIAIITAILALAIATPAQAGTAFYKREYISGMNKICIYDHLGSEVAITIRATSLCPLSIDV
jgi:ABC-type spermidine/putrescine transport system permease subunit II